MSTYTTNYNLEKPDSGDDFKDFRSNYNSNMDIIDKGLGNKNIANEYDDTSTYNVDEYVIYEGVLYKCTTAVTVAEPFDNTKWTAVLVTDEMGGGGGSAHTIVNESGTSLADEPNLQFTDGLKATDDSVNSKTVVGVNTTFTEAVTRTNIASGDTFATILGKIKKFFTDLKTVAFTGNSSDLNNDAGFITSDDTKIPLKTDAGLGYIYGAGESGYCLVADINTNANYINYPIYFEISGRGVEFTNVCIQFASKSSPDPDLEFFHIDTNNKDYFRLFKISNGLWRLYFLIGSWETCTLHRVSGSGSNRCTVKMEKTTTLPDTWANGVAPTYGGYSNFADTANYATSAGSATDNTKVAKSGDTMTGKLTVNNDVEVYGDLYAPFASILTLNYHDDVTDRNLNITRPLLINTGGRQEFQDKSGTIALTSDIPTNNNQLTNGAGYITGSDVLLRFGTPFMFANDNNSKVRFTFSGLGSSESIHLLLFIRYGAYEIYCTCGANGFGSATCTKLSSNSMDLTVTAYNDSFVIIAGITTWTAGYGLFIHPHFPNATMTITKYS